MASDDNTINIVTAAFVIIGNELLSGRTKDLNTSTLATTGIQRLKSNGTVDTSANNSTINNYWQATTATSSPGTPSDTNGNRPSCLCKCRNHVA